MSNLAALLLALSATGTPNADAVWHWQDCAQPRLVRVTIDVDRSRLLETTLPVCRAERRHMLSEPEQRKVDFPAAQLASLLGDKDARNLTGNIWEAGAESDGLMLGVSFQTNERVLLNTLHPVRLAEDGRSEIAPGVVISTSLLAAPDGR